MVRVQITGLCLAALALVAVSVPAAWAEKKEVRTTRQYSGSVGDEKLVKGVGACITSDKEFKRVWEAWKITGKVPPIDFAKELVLVVHSSGGTLRLARVTLDEKGNMEALGFGTLDLRPGFRYVLATVPRAGVKTVGGKALPKN